MIVPVIQCNCCQCRIETDGIHLLGGLGFIVVYTPGVFSPEVKIAEKPLENARFHLCTNCFTSIKKLPTITDQCSLSLNLPDVF